MKTESFKGALLSTLMIASLTALAISTMSLPSVSPTSAQLNPENIAIVHNIEDENVYHITLITGDVVIVSDIGDEQRTLQIIPADPDSGVAFQMFKGPDGTYVLPSGADLNRMDMNFFNIDYLIERSYYEMEYLPVIIGTSSITSRVVSRAVSIQDIEKPTQTLCSIEAGIKDFNGKVTMNSPRLSILAAKLPIDVIKESTEMLLKRLDVEKIWLDKKVQVSLNESVPLIGAPELWAAGDNGAGIRIAILDTGIDVTHPDLDDLDDNVETYDPKVTVVVNFTDDSSAEDLFGHGTHCAGIAAGTGKASNYLYRGVAPGAYLWNIKVLNRYGRGYDSWIISGIQYAALGPDGVENTGDEAHVISMSFGVDINGDGTDPISTAVDWATDRRVTCVAAAGNSGPGMFTVGMPAVARKVITVGATTKADDIIYFSSRGPTADYRLKPDIVAPGVDIIAPRASGTSMGSPIDIYYTRASGTSMSAPHVSGAAALLLQAHPNWSPIMVKAALMGNAKVLENVYLWDQGAGRITVPEAENTGLVAIEPSLSFGMLGQDENKVATLTLINLTDSLKEASISTYIECENIETNYASVNPISLTIPAHENADVLVRVGPLDENAPEGWYEGWINITYDQGTLKVPLLFAALSTVSVDIYDLDNSRIFAGIVLAEYPSMAFASSAWETPAQFYIKGGNYAVLTQCAWIEKEGHWPPEWQRMFMMERALTVPRLSEVHVNISLAEALVSEIPTADNAGENLTTHCYTQYFSGDPYYNGYVGVTMMNWSMGGGWSGFDINVPELTSYSSEFDPPENLSQAFGFYASDNLLSEVYLLNWKYRNVSYLPPIIMHSYPDLAKYDFYYDMPETYPENGLNSMNAFWFTWENIGGFQGWGGDVHRVPAGISAKYYLAPLNATYWGYYMPTYGGWDRHNLGPLEEWEIGRHYPYPQISPEKGETGSLVRGDFQFAPYIPGLSLDITLENESYIISLTGDIWENLAWPHLWWWSGALLSPYPVNRVPHYRLYVDDVEVKSGTLGRPDGTWHRGLWWDNIENSWDVIGENGRLEIHMPSLATISKWTTYELSFDLADNVHISSIFENIVMHLSYSPDENITIQLETPAGIENIVLEYSFDNGTSWETAWETPHGYLIPCEMADGLTIRISATDQYRNSLVYTSAPVSLAERVVLSVPERVPARPGDTMEISGNITTLEGKGLESLAVALSDNNKIITYASSNENGFFTLTHAAPPAIGEYDFAIMSPSVGVYQSSEAPVRLIVKYFPEVSISPSEQKGLPGELLTYVVLVANIGTFEDNYNLTVSDSAGWASTISPTLLTVPAGENRTAVLSVTVPTDPAPGASTTVTVTATSTTDPTVSASASCIAKSILAYTKSSPPYEWVARTSTTDVANGDDIGTWITLPFEFPFWGEPKTRVYVCSNGFLIFDPTPPTNDCGNSLGELINRWKIAPFWDDLRTDVAGGIVSYPGVYVDNYADKVVITWDVTRFGASSDSIKFQVVLYSNGAIRINIDNATNFWNFSPTLGISRGDNVYYFDITDERGTNKSWFFSLRRRGVDVLISPSYQSGLAGETLNYVVAVMNLSENTDNYTLESVDNMGWDLVLENNMLEVPGGESRHTTLSVTIPENATPCTEDNITVIVTSQENAEVSDNDSCIAHAGKADFELENLYAVTLDFDYYLNEGSKLVAKFYAWGGGPQGENVVWSGTTPEHIVLLKDIPHPQDKAVEKVRLDLTTDNTENVISTIASFVMRRSDLMKRISEIKGRWPFAEPPEKSALISEISGIKGQWSFAPA